MKKILFFLILISLISLFISSCSSDEESTTSASATMIDSTGATVNIDGTYSNTCTASGTTSSKQSIVISGTSVYYQSVNYEDTTCTTEALTFKWTYKSLANNGSDTVDSKTVTKISFTTVSTEITPNSSTYTTYANAGSWCSKTDWVEDTTYDATGVTCTNLTGGTNKAAGVDLYDIWYLSGTSLQTAPSALTTGYPTSIDSTVFSKE